MQGEENCDEYTHVSSADANQRGISEGLGGEPSKEVQEEVSSTMTSNSIAVAGNERSVNMTHASSASAAQRCTSAGRVEEPIKEEDKEVPSIMRADLYTEGQNRELDKKYLAYKKMKIWRGPAVSGALRGD